MAFTKIKFTCSVYRPKGNSGTTSCVVSDLNGNVLNLSGNGGYVCPTTGTKEFIIPKPFNFAFSVTLRRYIDTRSNGNAYMTVELYDEFAGKWVRLIYDGHYRTGNGWESKTYSCNVSAVIANSGLDYSKIPLKIYKNNQLLSTYDLFATKFTNKALQYNYKEKTYYGSLVTFKPSSPTLIVNVDGTNMYLSNDINNFNYKFNKDFLQPAYSAESGEKQTGYCKYCKIIFNSRGQTYGSHRGHDGTHYGNLYIIAIDTNGQCVYQNSVQVWNWLGGDSTRNANISNKIILDKNFDRPVNITCKWVLDLGGYKAHIWGGRSDITAVAHVDINISCK